MKPKMALLIALSLAVLLSGCDAMFAGNIFKDMGLGQPDKAKVLGGSAESIAEELDNEEFRLSISAAEAAAVIERLGLVILDGDPDPVASLQAKIEAGEVAALDIIVAATIAATTGDAGLVTGNLIGQVFNPRSPEDINGNGILDEGEDLDANGELTPPTEADFFEAVLPASISSLVIEYDPANPPSLADIAATPADFAAIIENIALAGTGFEAVIGANTATELDLAVGDLAHADVAQFALLSVVVSSLEVDQTPAAPEAQAFLADFAAANGGAVPTTSDVLWAAMNGVDGAMASLGSSDNLSAENMVMNAGTDANGDLIILDSTGDPIPRDENGNLLIPEGETIKLNPANPIGSLVDSLGLLSMFVN